MGHLVDQLQATGTLSRRAFVGAGIAAAGAFALAGCSPTEQTPQGSGDEGEVAEEPLPIKDPELDPAVDGKWVQAACWHNCGGRCINYAFVADGVVIRQKTDDTHEDSPDYPQQRSCLRGRSQQQQCFGADRLKYPMKRKHWEPHTGGDKSLRGRDEWERISWDEALDYVAEELRYARENYGASSIFHPTAYTGFECTWVSSFLNYCGGFTSVWSTGSQGTFRFNPEPYYGYGTNLGNDRYALREAELIVFYGCNPAWASNPISSYNIDLARKAGAKFMSVGPFYDTSASVFDAEWIPVRLGGDIPFLLAVAYVMITEDDPEANPLIDWDYINRCTVGFNAEMMPADAKLNENFHDYVLGEYDGIPKTPEWASPLCGTPVEKIREFANAIGVNNKVSLLHSYAPARQKSAESFPQLLMTIGCMGGHFGREGHSWSTGYLQSCANDGPTLVTPGASGVDMLPMANDDCICTSQLWDAILTGKYNYTGIGYPYYQFNKAEERDIDIHVIYHEYGSYLQNFENINKGIEAHRKVDFVVCHSQFYKAEAQYADIVLPVTTEWERFGTVTFLGVNNRECLVSHFKVVEPLYEAKDDRWICAELCTRLGLDPEGLYPLSEEQMFFNKLSGAQVMKEDGSGYEPLIAITEEDIERWGVEGEPHDGRISLAEYEEKGFYQVERHEGDAFYNLGMKAFREDPENNPRGSKSGKMEIYSDTYADVINGLAYNKEDSIKPYPTYRPYIDGYESTFVNGDVASGQKAEYPFQLFTPHYLRRAHAVLDNVLWVREAMRNPVYLNRTDAEAKGIEEGDTVLIYSANGKVLRHATLTERLIPGTIALPHGGWVNIDEETGIDNGGAENMLNPGGSSVSGVSGFNSCLVNFEKYDGDPIPDDCDMPQRIIEL